MELLYLLNIRKLLQVLVANFDLLDRTINTVEELHPYNASFKGSTINGHFGLAIEDIYDLLISFHGLSFELHGRQLPLGAEEPHTDCHLGLLSIHKKPSLAEREDPMIVIPLMFVILIGLHRNCTQEFDLRRHHIQTHKASLPYADSSHSRRAHCSRLVHWAR